jgi:hypothetical protein
MQPREVTWTFEHAILSDIEVEVDPRDPNAVIGQLQLINLGEVGGRKYTVSLCFPRHKPEELLKLQEMIFPRVDADGGPLPHPTILRVTVGIELDRSLRLVSWEENKEKTR